MVRPNLCKRSSAPCEGTEGIVYVEFLLAFMPVFLMALGIAQMALMYTANLMVKHAAVIATRAAVVVLPDDPMKYSGATQNSLADGPANVLQSPVEAIIGFLQNGTIPAAAISTPVGSFSPPGAGTAVSSGTDPLAVYAGRNARYMAIHDAASVPLLSLAPSFAQTAQPTVRGALRDGNPTGGMASALAYNRAAMSVTFPQAPGSATFVNQYSEMNAPVTVRVTYMFYCGIPIIRSLMCDSGSTIRPTSGNAAAPSGTPAHQAQIAAGSTELKAAPIANAALLGPINGQRFAVLRGEATMPLQGASYEYRVGPREPVMDPTPNSCNGSGPPGGM